MAGLPPFGLKLARGHFPRDEGRGTRDGPWPTVQALELPLWALLGWVVKRA